MKSVHKLANIFFIWPRSRLKQELNNGGQGEDLVLDLTGLSLLDHNARSLVQWLEGELRVVGGRLGLVATPQQAGLIDLDMEMFPTYTDALVILNGNPTLLAATTDSDTSARDNLANDNGAISTSNIV